VDVGHAAATDQFADLITASELAHAVRNAFNHKLFSWLLLGR
jgi:hypothetical protein